MKNEIYLIHRCWRTNARAFRVKCLRTKWVRVRVRVCAWWPPYHRTGVRAMAPPSHTRTRYG